MLADTFKNKFDNKINFSSSTNSHTSIIKKQKIEQLNDNKHASVPTRECTSPINPKNVKSTNEI